jgi:hypothetical protein
MVKLKTSKRTHGSISDYHVVKANFDLLARK